MRTLLVDDEPVAIRRLRRLLAAFDHVDIVGEAGNAEDAAALVTALKPDLVLLDIEMPGRNGIALAADLTSGPHPPAVVFVTAYGGFALAAFHVAAEHYLLKPVEPEHLAAALDRVGRRLAEQRLAERADELEGLVVKLRASETASGPQAAHLWLPDARGHARVPLGDVVWIAADRDYVRVHVAGRSYFARRRIGQLADELVPHGFVRVHRSALIRRDAVRHVENAGDRVYRITMTTGDDILTSRRFASAVRDLTADPSSQAPGA